MLNLPVYLRGNTYYLHTRIQGVQLKRSLRTSNKKIATLRALEFLKAIFMKIDLSKIAKFELDMERGFAKATPGEDTHAMLRAMEIFERLHSSTPNPFQGNKVERASTPDPFQGENSKGIKPQEVLEKYLLLKSHLRPATAITYRNAVKEFQEFLRNPNIQTVKVSDVTRYQEHLASGGKNSARTRDNKMSILSALFAFAIKQGHYFEINPAEGRCVVSKKQRMMNGYEHFELTEITKIYQSDYFLKQKADDKDYYFVLVLALLTGCRVGEITSLKVSQLQETYEKNAYYIKICDAKTNAGVREIPIPNSFVEEFLQFIGSKKGDDLVFKYLNRNGKGTGNAVGKKFSRHLELLGIKRDKLVFHSIRKFVNDFFIKNKVEYEPRLQILGHESGSVNIQTYSKKFTPEELVDIISPVQEKILSILKKS